MLLIFSICHITSLNFAFGDEDCSDNHVISPTISRKRRYLVFPKSSTFVVSFIYKIFQLIILYSFETEYT